MLFGYQVNSISLSNANQKLNFLRETLCLLNGSL